MKYLLLVLLLSSCSVFHPYKPYPYSGICVQFVDSATKAFMRQDRIEWELKHNYYYYKKHHKK